MTRNTKGASMNHEPILFFAVIDDERKRCPHGKVLPMPKTREQRQAERDDFTSSFLWGFLGAWSLFMLAAVYFMRGGR